MRRIVLVYVDSENVSNHWLPWLEKESAENPYIDLRVRVFYTNHGAKLSYDELGRLNKINAIFQFTKCKEGTNALDFQLCTQIGHDIGTVGEGIDIEYVIISCDRGYDAVVSYWKERNMNVRRVAINTAFKVDGNILSIPGMVTEKDMMSNCETLLSQITCINSDDRAAVRRIIMSFAKNDQINSNSAVDALRYDYSKEFGSEKGNTLFNQTKKVWSNILGVACM